MIRLHLKRCQLFVNILSTSWWLDAFKNKRENYPKKCFWTKQKETHPRRPRGSYSRVGRKGGKKVFKYGRKSPWVPTQRTISKNSSGYRLLIGHKKCFVLLCPIGEQFLPSSFREFVHDGYCLATLARFKILSARKLKTVFQKYKLELTTGIHACIGHVLRKY